MPPYAVRLLAREHNRSLTAAQIAQRSGLSKTIVWRISNLDNWLPITVEQQCRFTAACGVDLLHLREHLQMIRRTNGLRDARHLQRDKAPVSLNLEFYERLLAKMPRFVEA